MYWTDRDATFLRERGSFVYVRLTTATPYGLYVAARVDTHAWRRAVGRCQPGLGANRRTAAYRPCREVLEDEHRRENVDCADGRLANLEPVARA